MDCPALQPSAVSAERIDEPPQPEGLRSEAGCARVPALIVGRHPQGFWIVRDDLDLIGGVFCTRESAMRFAADEAARGRGSVRLLGDPVVDLPAGLAGLARLAEAA